MSDDPNYCAYCYGEAKKHGRAVRQTDVCEWRICTLCESRIRNGLVHYNPSNGTEYRIFEGRCGECRHHIDDVESCPSLDKPVMCS